MKRISEQVVVIGAGPVGMTAALELSRLGINVLLLEKRSSLCSDGSRAIVIHRNALEVLERNTCLGPVLRQSTSLMARTTYFRGRLLYKEAMPSVAPGEIPLIVNLAQSETEQCLLAELERRSNVTIAWGHTVTSFSQTSEEITLVVTTPSGETAITTKYVIACDGCRSPMRNLAGIKFPGKTHKDHFLIVDIHLKDRKLSDESEFHFDHPTNPGRTTFLVPQPGNILRMDWQIDPRLDPEAELADDRLHARIRAVFPNESYEIVWRSHYRFHQRLATHFNVGRLFLAGDAVHMMAPFGARGMNSGILDAENLAWKLARVIKGESPVGLLRTYHTERHAAGLENQRVTKTSMRFIAPSTYPGRLLRNLLLVGSIKVPWLKRFVDRGKLSAPYCYNPLNSTITLNTWLEGATNQRARGRRLDDAECLLVEGEEQQSIQFRHLVGKGYLLLALGVDSHEAKRIFDRELSGFSDKGVKPLAVTTQESVALWGGNYLTTLIDLKGGLTEQLACRTGEKTLVLVRPDGHVAFQCPYPTSSGLQVLVKTALGSSDLHLLRAQMNIQPVYQ